MKQIFLLLLLHAPNNSRKIMLKAILPTGLQTLRHKSSDFNPLAIVSTILVQCSRRFYVVANNKFPCTRSIFFNGEKFFLPRTFFLLFRPLVYEYHIICYCYASFLAILLNLADCCWRSVCASGVSRRRRRLTFKCAL